MSISSDPVTSLMNATSGAGRSADFGLPVNDISLAIIVNGTVTGGMVSLDVSHNGVDFILFSDVGDPITTAEGNQKLTASGESWRYARARITSPITGGGSVTCTVMGGGAV